MKRKLKPFDRYEYYRRAVQSPPADYQFIMQAYRDSRKARPFDLREDFCGTFANCCEWVRRGKGNRAIGIDLDREPLDYGLTNYFTKLRKDQRARLDLIQGSVLTAKVRPVDVVIAFNFSFYLFKSRLMLRRYFQRAFKGLKRDGIFILDCFGGQDCQEANEESSKISNFQYYWEQSGYDPISAGAEFHIHFKRKGEKKRERVFSYDWRLWTIPEIRELLLEAGFKKSHVYWEGTTRAGHGNGDFKRREKGEECNGWVAYIVAER